MLPGATAKGWIRGKALNANQGRATNEDGLRDYTVRGSTSKACSR